MTRRPRFRSAAFVGVVVLIVMLAVIPAALAGKGKTGGGGKPAAFTGSFELVPLNSTDGLLHYGQDVTFDVTSNAYHPMVTLTCYQGADWVKNQSVGFYAGWPWSQIFNLSSWKWPGGAADCTAALYYTDARGRNRTLATVGFHVYA